MEPTTDYIDQITALVRALETTYPNQKISVRLGKQETEWNVSINFFDENDDIAFNDSFTIPFGD